MPPHLQELFRDHHRPVALLPQRLVLGGEAKLRVEGEKMELTSLPAEEWAQVVKDAEGFWDEVAAPARAPARSSRSSRSTRRTWRRRAIRTGKDVRRTGGHARPIGHGHFYAPVAMQPCDQGTAESAYDQGSA